MPALEESGNVASWPASKARHQFRTNPEYEGKSTSGFCMRHVQTNLAILPASLADEFEQFCNLNKAPCPLLYKSKPGELSAGNLAQDSDVRTDLPMYWVSEYGNVTKKVGNLTSYPLEDFVSFYLGCSFSFEDALMKAGIELQHVVKKRNVSMFKTNISCLPVGPFDCPMVVSMRPIPRELVEKTVIVTAAYDAVHGAPIHIGDPSVIGIDDIDKTNFGESSDVADMIPVFWACGVTSSVAVRSAKLPLSFSHQPGSMFICDTTLEEYFRVNEPEHGNEQPKLITLADQPFLASVCSETAFKKVEKLSKLLGHQSGFEGDVYDSDFLKISARLSHAPSVVIGILDEEIIPPSELATSDGLQGVITLVKALQAVKKKITIITEHNSQVIHDCVAASASQGISEKDVHIVTLEDSGNLKDRLFPGNVNHKLDTVIALQMTTEFSNSNSGSERTIQVGLVDKLFQEVYSFQNGIVSVKITTNRQETSPNSNCSSVYSHVMVANSVQTATLGLSAALYVLNSCPIHSRYLQHGIGKREVFQVGQFLVNNTGQEKTCHQILDWIKDI